MARRKKAKRRKVSKKRLTAGQKRAVQAMLAARGISYGGKSSKKTSKKKSHNGDVASHYHSGARGYASGFASENDPVARHYRSHLFVK